MSILENIQLLSLAFFKKFANTITNISINIQTIIHLKQYICGNFAKFKIIKTPKLKKQYVSEILINNLQHYL